MKTTNSKLQKAGMETLAVWAVIFASCFTITAQGSVFKNRLEDTHELASIETIKASKTFPFVNEASAEMGYFAELLEVEYESELPVESWMTEAAYFGMAKMEADMEEKLKLEEWMINEVLFKKEESAANQEEHTDVSVDKKDKTIGVNFPGVQFGRRTFILVEMEDPTLELKPWMFDPNTWKLNK